MNGAWVLCGNQNGDLSWCHLPDVRAGTKKESVGTLRCEF